MRIRPSLINSPIFILSFIIFTSIIIKLLVFYKFYLGYNWQITSSDTITYTIPAKLFLATGKFFDYTNKPMIIRTPGYPLFVALIFSIFGNKLPAIIITQIFLSSISISSSYLICKRILSSKIGLIAASLTAANYLLLTYTFNVMSDMLFSLLLAVFFLLGTMILTQNKPNYRNIFFWGLFLALATLVRPVSYFLLIPVLVGLVYYGIRQHFETKSILISLSLFIIPSIILVGGWQVRNKIVTGSYQYTSIMSSQYGLKQYFPKNYQIFAKKNLANPRRKITATTNILQNFHILFDHPTLTLQYFSHGLYYDFENLDMHFINNFLAPTQYFYLPNFVKDDFIHFRLKKLWLILQYYPNDNRITIVYYFVLFFLNLYYLVATIGFIVICTRMITRTQLSAHVFLFGSLLYFLFLSTDWFHVARYYLPFQIILDMYAATGLFFIVQTNKNRLLSFIKIN